MVHTKMSHHDRMEVFLEKYREPLPKPLEELERKALSEDVPIIRSGGSVKPGKGNLRQHS